MKLSDSFFTALDGLKTNRGRSALTILGIIIGIAAVITMMSVGQGVQNLILSQIQSIGSKVIAIVPGRQPKGPTDVISTFTDSLRQTDLEALKKKSNVPHLETLMPVVFGSETAAFGSETYRLTIFGVTENFSKIHDLYPTEGRLFSDEETKGYADVVIIGNKVKDELFGSDEALDRRIKIKGRNFRVIGILPKKGQSSFLNFDEVAIIPYTTAQQYIFGIKYFHRLVAETDSEANVDQTVEDIKITLRNSHNITDPSKDDFFIETQTSAMEIVSTITNILTLFLAAVAGISLLVGGIGIMNIMLVSVTERTREIGLRKAVGAGKNDILIQFLLEAVLLTLTGGILGIAFGVLLSLGASLIFGYFLKASWGFLLPLNAIALGVGVSVMIGLIFGIYPAHKAAELSPIEALRYE